MADLTTDITFEAMTSPLALKLAAMAVGLLILAGLIMLVLVRAGRRSGSRPRPLWADNDGTATIEFALILPILLFVILTLTQVTFLMGGNLFVHYSAYTACRSAIVQIPTGYGDAPNTISDGSSKHDAVRRSAVFALLPVAGQSADAGGGSGGSGISGADVVSGLEEFYSGYGQQPPEWIQARIAERVSYADANTTVTIERPVIGAGHTITFEPADSFEPKDPVTVRVEHRLNLSMPYVSRIFADGDHGEGTSGGGRYMNILARATLTNEGIRDEMPPPPELPRIY